MPGFEDQVERIVDLHGCHKLLDSVPDNSKVLILIDDGENYRSARVGDLTAEGALWMIRAFEHSVLFPRIVPRGG